MNWNIKEFDELTINELYEILKVRAEVFITEQNCVYQDLDSKDKKSYHLFLEDNEKIIAYLRILPRGVSYPEAAIGRVLTQAAHRKKGISREMLKRAIDFIVDTLKEDKIRISAQRYLLEFYKSLGFQPTSDVYLEDGIEHIEMLYQKQAL
ncbi:MAG: GNAT family N-acetyltransferase [Muricomes sp.]